ncbi:MAG: AMP-binding protein, partial [bacterium]|nr:AMP-binding protein [bacterium]
QIKAFGGVGTFSRKGSDPPEAQLYRSGDLGRLTADGEMEYLGRIDHQVQMRGFRIELGEIETQLLKHEEVRDAVVIYKQDGVEEGQLCAYIVTKTEGKGSDLPLKLREYLVKRLPQYMIPSYIVLLEKIPLTPNGKLDRKALPEPGLQERETYVPPRNDIEKQLAKIWQEAMQVERIGITENYFNIGGDSIKAIRLINAVNREMDTGLTIPDLYQNDTIQQLAAQIAAKIKAPEEDEIRKRIKEAAQEIETIKTTIFAEGKQPKEIEEIYPLSDIEAGMLYAGVMQPGKAVYHDQITYQVTYEKFEQQTFKQALELMAAKHPILRTGFNMGDYSEPLQIVYKKIKPEPCYYEIAQKERTLQEEHIKRYLAKDRENPFDITKPLWRMRVFGLGDRQYLVMLICHHAIMDGWSVASFSTELNNIYLALQADPHYRPQPLKSSYKDFIIEQRAWRGDRRTIEFWKKELDQYKRFEIETLGISPLGTGEKGKPTAGGSNGMKRYGQSLDEPVIRQLEQRARSEKTSLKHLFIGAYLYTLGMYTYDNEIVAGLVTNNRPVTKDADKILGCFLNSVPIRKKIPGDITWQDYIRQVEKKLLELKNHDRLPLTEIAGHIGEVTQKELRNPIFDTLFNYVDFHIYRQAETGPESPRQTERKTGDNLQVEGHALTNMPLSFSVNMTDGHAQLIITYDAGQISGGAVERLSTGFRDVLDKMINHPARQARKDDLITEAEKQRLLIEFNETETKYPKDKTIHRLFEEQVRKSPDNVSIIGSRQLAVGKEKIKEIKENKENKEINEQKKAVDVGGIHEAPIQHNVQISYRQLNEQANRLAGKLIEKGVTPGTIVAIMVERSLEIVIAILGIL